MKKIAWVTMLLGGVAMAQQPRAPKQVGQARALGGDVQHIWIAGDQRHALTQGEHGDFIWWDLRERRPVQHLASRSPAVIPLLHPTLPLLILGRSNGLHNDPVDIEIVDLQTGSSTPWLRRELWAMCLDHQGRRLAVRSNKRAWIYELDPSAPDKTPEVEFELEPEYGNWIEFEVDGRLRMATRPAPSRIDRKAQIRSADGRHKLRTKRHENATLVRDGVELTFACEETSLMAAAVSDQGTVLASDLQGQLHFVAVDEPRATVRARHEGTPQRLTFSPDGKFVAIQTLGAVRIVDLSGQVVFDHEGSAGICAGADGSEFWLFTRKRCWRYHAASAQVLGDILTTASPTSVITDRPHTDYSLWSLVRRSTSIPTPLTLMAGEPVRARDNGNYLTRWNGNGFDDLPGGTQGSVVGLAPLPDGTLALVTGSFDAADGSYNARLTMLTQNGTARQQREVNALPGWCATDETGSTIWVGDEGLVHVFDAADIDKGHAFESTSITGTYWKHGQLLVSNAHQYLVKGIKRVGVKPGTLQLIDGRTGELRTEWPVPEGMNGAYCIGVSPDRSHIAIADGADVRILRAP